MTDRPATAGALAAAGPELRDRDIVFRLPDPEHRYRTVRLYQELQRPRDGLVATAADGGWTVTLPRPDRRPDGALRMEYAFVVDHVDGGQAFVTDPANPLVAEGPFGAKSVLELPGYLAPTWRDREPPDGPGTLTWVELPLPRFDVGLPCGLWEPAGVQPDARLPLLIVHDGPEYAELAGLCHLLAIAITDGRVTPLRAALLGPVPGRRDETYSAAARYADALALTVRPWLTRTAPQPSGVEPVLMGASLGALAALHTAQRHPGRFGGLFLQSGSYFRARTDGHERGFSHFDRVACFVGEVLRGRTTTAALPVTLTCGTVEENLANNRLMAQALGAVGHDVAFVTHRDGHTYGGWRDSLDPHLIDLLVRTFGAPTGRG